MTFSTLTWQATQGHLVFLVVLCMLAHLVATLTARAHAEWWISRKATWAVLPFLHRVARWTQLWSAILAGLALLFFGMGRWFA